RPGSVAIREIKYYQRTTHLLIQRLPYSSMMHLIQEILEYGPLASHKRFQRAAVEAIHLACEDYLTGLFMDATDCMIHACRVTLKKEDLKLAYKLRHSLN
ncbi:hypothetical protein CROQUDRAFT_41246, partial [Cronartium quercuum f. sp. fusiforme G11]